MKNSLVCLYQNGKSKKKNLQWPCYEPLNTLRATSIRKPNCLHRKLHFFLPPPVRKKGNPEVTMERLRYTLDQELRLALI